jgi:large subunit ribosomal protein L25
MENIEIQANKRTVVGKKVKVLRREGQLPAIIYGQGIEPIPISLQKREATRTIAGITSSSLVNLLVDDETITTLIRDRQFDPVTNELLHVDFLKVSLTEKLTTNVGLEFVGESVAVKELGGIPVTSSEFIEIEALPQDLPDRIEVDLSVLEEIGDSIFVKDLVLPPNIRVLTHPEELVVSIMAPAAEVEEEEEEEVFEEGEEPELVERGKQEEPEED